MICYRDMTFCPFDDCRHFTECYRALTKDVEENAKEWSKTFGVDGALICQYTEKPVCFENNLAKGE